MRTSIIAASLALVSYAVAQGVQGLPQCAVSDLPTMFGYRLVTDEASSKNAWSLSLMRMESPAAEALILNVSVPAVDS